MNKTRRQLIKAAILAPVALAVPGLAKVQPSSMVTADSITMSDIRRAYKMLSTRQAPGVGRIILTSTPMGHNSAFKERYENAVTRGTTFHQKMEELLSCIYT